MNLVNTPFSEQFPLAQLHWIISDETASITVESIADGLHIYDNPVGVLTNNPPFPQQMFQLNNYMHLSSKQPVNTFADDLTLTAYSRGMGALGLPGDLSSASRFARVAFTKMNSISGDSEAESISQFFHILGSVDQQRGCCEVTEGKYEITLYTSCCNATKGIYYYTTYENHQISAVDMHRENLDGTTLICYPVIQGRADPFSELGGTTHESWKFNAVKKFLGNLYPESSEIPEVSSGSQHSCQRRYTLRSKSQQLKEK